jgi:hypothetical protein
MGQVGFEPNCGAVAGLHTQTGSSPHFSGGCVWSRCSPSKWVRKLNDCPFREIEEVLSYVLGGGY